MAAVRRFIVSVAAAIVILAVAYAGVSWAVVNQALVAEAHPVDRSPAEQGLAFEDIAFHPRGKDHLTLRGWWIPADDPKGAIIWIHGLDSARDSHLELLRDLRGAGFSMLAFDLRGHGDSDKAPMTAGILEQTDVQGAIDYLRNQQGIAIGKIGLMGMSYGAAIALMAAPPEVAVGGVFADSPFADITDLIVQGVADRTPLPGWAARLMQPGLVWAGAWFRGISIDQVRPEASAAQIPYPIAIVHCADDTRVPASHAVRIAASAPEGSALALVDGCDHGRAYDLAPAQYTLAAVQYFDERFGVLAP